MGSSNSGSDDYQDPDEVEERPWRQLLRHGYGEGGPPQLTLRSIVVGVSVGTVLCFTNMYFGLQTGWVTMGSIQSALLGYGVFQLPFARWLGLKCRHFGALENVVVQTIAVATATLPLAGGFIGIIPALGLLNPPVVLSMTQQLLWAAALTYFGIFFAVPLRRQTILVEQLTFPSGTATAKLIDLLHSGRARSGAPTTAPSDSFGSQSDLYESGPIDGQAKPWCVLGTSFVTAFGVSALSFYALPTADPTLHVFNWIGFRGAATWRWTIRPTLGVVGQGMIMGAKPAISLLIGAVIAWGWLGPLSRSKGWASGKIFDFEHGAQGWVLWVSIALMVAEALTAFVVVLLEQCLSNLRKQSGKAGRHRGSSDADAIEVAPNDQLVPISWWVGGIVAAYGLCVSIVAPMFSLPAWHVGVAVMLSCLVAVLAVRALGQTDLNPVSGVGKLSQIVFAIVAPGHVVANIVAGALAEAGAMQAGDLLQDLKAGHLLQASPRAQFYGQLIGATLSVFITVGVYQLYDSAYTIPSTQFPAPVANVWKDMALLMNRGLGALPPSAIGYAKGFAAIGMGLPLLEACLPPVLAPLLPSGMSIGVGMYLTADFVLPRVLGALAVLLWRKADAPSHSRYMLVVASGFVLGEGVWSIVALGLKSLAAH